jgi:hypothetical protein
MIADQTWIDVHRNSINALEGLLRHDPARKDVQKEIEHHKKRIEAYEMLLGAFKKENKHLA